MDKLPLTDPVSILAVLTGVAGFFLLLEKQTKWKFFELFPPLVFIYAVPLVLSNTNVIPHKSPLDEWMTDAVLPMFLILMLLDIDVVAAVRTMGKGILVLLFGTAGVIVGAPVAYALVKHGLDPDAWKGFGALAGSWIGGTGNMAAVAEGLEASKDHKGLAILSDALVYLVWLPILLGSKRAAKWFHRVARVDPERMKVIERSANELVRDKGKPEMRHYLYLLFLGFSCAWVAATVAPSVAKAVAQQIPELGPVLTAKSWKILLITTLGILLSTTPARKIPGSHELAAALVLLFVAKMGAEAKISGLAAQAGWFVLGAFIWIAAHGGFCILGAMLFRVDIHSTAIASAANIGGVASAPIVAACHNEKLVPVSILMALIGYAIGNYGALLAALLCSLIA